jgi:hypothetical protein
LKISVYNRRAHFEAWADLARRSGLDVIVHDSDLL